MLMKKAQIVEAIAKVTVIAEALSLPKKKEGDDEDDDDDDLKGTMKDSMKKSGMNGTMEDMKGTAGSDIAHVAGN